MTNPSPSISTIIIDLAVKQAALSDYIDHCLRTNDADPADIARLLALHGQNASRLGRLLRDQQALGGDALSALDQAISAALDELSQDLGIDL